jgi:hypothetical protein
MTYFEIAVDAHGRIDLRTGRLKLRTRTSYSRDWACASRDTNQDYKRVYRHAPCDFANERNLFP